jgi:hypothetical protein
VTGGTWTSLRWEAPALTAPYETVADVAAYAGGFVAVGQLQTEHGNEAAAWISTDWRSWTRTFLDIPAAGDSTLWHVLPAGSGLVAIGSSGVQHCLPPPGEGQVCDPLPIGLWTSSDGRAWHKVPTPAVLAGASIASVAAGPTGLVLVGDTGWDKPGIWTSTDGVAWHRETLAGGVFGKAHFLGIAVAAGGWVLTGFVGGSQPVCCAAARSYATPAAWFSADGAHGQRGQGRLGHVHRPRFRRPRRAGGVQWERQRRLDLPRWPLVERSTVGRWRSGDPVDVGRHADHRRFLCRSQ